MLAAASVPAANAKTTSQQQHAGETDPLVLYARSLHDYTLRLWTESRRIAEEKARSKAAAFAATDNNRADVLQAPKRTSDAKVKA